MLDQQERAKSALNGDNITFAAVSAKGELRTSWQKGIAPLMDFLKTEPEFLKGAFVADKVIGKAAAFLLVKGDIRHLYTEVISTHGAEVLMEHQISFEYGKKVPYIINRLGDGMCPMEATVLEETDTETAYLKLQNKLVELRK